MPTLTRDGADALINVPPMGTVKRSSWKAERYHSMPFGDRDVIAIHRYGTLMLVIDAEDKTILRMTTGIGSVTDQHSMNRIFQSLGVAHMHYFTRKGGTAEIVDPRVDKRVPRYLRRINEVCGTDTFKRWMNGHNLSESEHQALYLARS